MAVSTVKSNPVIENLNPIREPSCNFRDIAVRILTVTAWIFVTTFTITVLKSSSLVPYTGMKGAICYGFIGGVIAGLVGIFVKPEDRKIIEFSILGSVLKR